MLMAAVAIFTSCKNSEAPVTGKDSASTTAATNFAYTTKMPVAWKWGSDSNIAIAMNALKAFETGDLKSSANLYADTTKFEFDYFDAMLSRDSVVAVLSRARAEFKNVSIVMNDYESVISKDGKDEYVSLWYKQYTEDMKGVKDSIECMNDIKFKNGKIVLLAEKTRHYGKK